MVNDGVNAFAPDSFSGLAWDSQSGEQFYKTAKTFTDPSETIDELKSKSILTEEQHRDIALILAKGRTTRLREELQKKHKDNKKKGIDAEMNEYSYAEMQVLEFMMTSGSSHMGIGRKQLRDTMIGYAEPQIDRPNNNSGRKKRRG